MGERTGLFLGKDGYQFDMMRRRGESDLDLYNKGADIVGDKLVLSQEQFERIDGLEKDRARLWEEFTAARKKDSGVSIEDIGKIYRRYQEVSREVGNN